MPHVLFCTFPFPAQSPPLEVPHPCVGCPNADRGILDKHSRLSPDNPELQAAIRSFAKWFYDPTVTAEEIEENIRYASQLYTRKDHTGTCIPKTLLFAHYKGLQFYEGDEPLMSDAAKAAINGEPVRSWPDGKIRSGPTWNQMFGEYTSGYE